MLLVFFVLKSKRLLSRNPYDDRANSGYMWRVSLGRSTLYWNRHFPLIGIKGEEDGGYVRASFT